MSRWKTFTEQVLPAIASSGRLGDNVEFVKCEQDESVSGEAQFASSVWFVTAEFRPSSNSKQQTSFKQPLVVKFNISDEAVRSWLKLDEQFQNEVITYDQVIPFLSQYGRTSVSEIFPKYFYGLACNTGDPNNYIIVLEDLKSKGFSLSPQVLDLDYDHCVLAFKRLGAFHALSFKAKRSNPKGFRRIVDKLVESKLIESNEEDWTYLFLRTLQRASQPLLDRGEKIEEIRRFKEKIEVDIFDYVKNVLSVNDSMGVFCHGDFCRNNVLFKYENGKPTDIRIFDLATCRYGSIMLDFCFFFFLNCSEDSRKAYKEEYLQIYHDSLKSESDGIEVPSLEEVKEEFKSKAVSALLTCLFFKPAMMDAVPFNPLEEVHKSIEDRAATVLKNGGQAGTQVISNMLLEFIDSKYVL